MKERNYKVYALICPIEDRVRYIGITTQKIKRRLSDHLNKNKNENPHKKNWIKILETKGLKPETKILFSNLNKDEAIKKEIELISFYRKKEGKKLTNISEGGNLPPVHRGENNPMYGMTGSAHPMYGKKRDKSIGERVRMYKLGKPLPESVKIKISETLKGKYVGENHPNSKPVYQIDIESGEILKKHINATEASKELNITRTGIVCCCAGRKKSAGGYEWRYVNES